MIIGINEMRSAIAYVDGDSGVEELTDEKLLSSDWLDVLKMGNIRVLNVVLWLQRTYSLDLSPEIFKVASDNTVGALLNAINSYIEEKAKSPD